MVADGGKTISVAERIAALQKGKDSSSSSTYKPSAVYKLPAAGRPLTTMSKENNALADRIAAFQNTAEKTGECRSHFNSISAKTKPSDSIHTNTDDGRRDDRTTEVATKSDSTLTKTNRPNDDPPPAKPNTISMASRISALQKTIDPESRSKSAHPIRNMTTSIPSSIGPTATQPLRPSLLQNTNEVQFSTTPDRFSPVRKLTMTRIAAADGVTKSQPPSNQGILTNSEVYVTPPKPKRQGPILKDATNRIRNEMKTKTSANLPSKTNSKINEMKAKRSANLPSKTSKIRQEAPHKQSVEYGMRTEKENTQVEEEFKSSTGVSDVDSDMITLPASNNKAMLDSSFDSASSWNHEKTIKDWQSFYTNFALPPPGVMLESQISTPVTKNTSRKNKKNNNNNDADLVVSQQNRRKGSRMKMKKDKTMSPPHRGHRRKFIRNTDESDSNEDFDTDDSTENFDLNGCSMIDEIWCVFSSLSSAV
eukprot:scaffold12428_cov140-Skeletonema_dohrnii-CCMP3373.AAC.1